MNHARRLKVVGLVAAVVIAGAFASASAEAVVRYPGSKQFVWAPATVPQGGSQDPITFIWRNATYVGNRPVTSHIQAGSVGTCNQAAEYYRCRVQLVMEHNWNGAGLAPRYSGAGTWYNHGLSEGPDASAVGTDKLCYSHTDALNFFGPPGTSSSQAIDEGTGSTTNYCVGNQYHARFWTDETHVALDPSDPSGDWLVGGIHHDKFQLKICTTLGGFVPYPCGGHTLTQSWNDNRNVLLTAMRSQCEQPRWGLAVGILHMYQGLPFDGVISRLSTGTRANNCVDNS